MIKATELRIGNWVKQLPSAVFFKLTARIIIDIEDGTQVFHPIDLTPEILEKCGFKKGEFNDYEKKLSPRMELLFYQGNGSKPRLSQDDNPIYF